jgi:hypothetical protein
MHTVCDVPEEWPLVKAQYASLIPHLDTSLLDNEDPIPWYVGQLQDPTRTKLTQQLSSPDMHHHHHDVIMRKVLATYPERVETALNTHSRVQAFKRYLGKFLE